MTDILGYGDDAVSVALQEVAAHDWIDQGKPEVEAAVARTVETFGAGL